MSCFEGPNTMKLPVSSDNKGGPGDYDGANGHGLPPRTAGHGGVPEKFIDKNVPGANPGTKAGG